MRELNVNRPGCPNTTDPVILVAEGTCYGAAWRQYFVVTDECVAIVEMVPALLGGWKFHRVSVQGAADWPGYKRDAIVEFKLSAGPPRSPGPSLAPDLGEFRAKLLAVAAAGKLPDRVQGGV